MKVPKHIPWIILNLFCIAASGWAQMQPIAEVMDVLVTTLCEGRSMEELAALDDAAIMETLTPEQRRILGEDYWRFDISGPAVVSVMRDVEQPVVPFWLEDRGFVKTELLVRNELYTYEVWRKSFPTGAVGLGINGFDRHRPHYFVGIGPDSPDTTVSVSNILPPREGPYVFDVGASIYQDWPDLTLTEVPEVLQGHWLLPTIRGRAREAQLLSVFRETLHPASETPDMIVLTWSDNPKTTQTVQWRTAETAPSKPRAQYRRHGQTAEAAWHVVEAETTGLYDRNIVNNRKVRWHRATFSGLLPDTDYEYLVGDADANETVGPFVFRTAPDTDRAFTFLWMSDTHSREESIPLLRQAWDKHPDTAFLTISGDLVGTGQQRDDWDLLFHNYAFFLRERPLMPSIGNHDAIDGLGSELYRTLLHLPDNGPDGFERGQSFSVRYGNLLLISLDVTDDIALQRPWLEATLRDSDALWKVAVLHFPPYALDREYPDIEHEWCSLFDQYQVDLALSGHVHYHLRTWPLKNGVRAESSEAGTRYLVSVAVPGRIYPTDTPEYAEVVKTDGKATCTAFTIDGSRLIMNSYAADGALYDALILEK